MPLVSSDAEAPFFQSGGDSETIFTWWGDLEIFFFSPDPISPVVTLISPSDADEDSDGIVLFGYLVTDDSDVDNCTLFLDNQIEQSDTTITKDIIQTFKVNGIKESDNLRWRVGCTDEFVNQGNSTEFGVDTKRGGGTVAGGGGGGRRLNVSLLCNLTYKSYLINDTSFINITNIRRNYTNLINQAINSLEVKNYITNWGVFCELESKPKPLAIVSIEPKKSSLGLIIWLIFIGGFIGLYYLNKKKKLFILLSDWWEKKVKKSPIDDLFKLFGKDSK